MMASGQVEVRLWSNGLWLGRRPVTTSGRAEAQWWSTRSLWQERSHISLSSSPFVKNVWYIYDFL
ncbi:hypothetical protein KFK09_025177 [Dendrobium nobile]|uniref:Uncharacterized protein n=1 Tax=Dendrobium nobile TaxID=94219 RepID=A0A8T3AFV2_DENNO|nr:hypothetical protein KFK09_025177 [Dendrobium nobile]